MDDVRRKALKRALIGAAILVPLFVYLDAVDNAGAPTFPHATAFFVALGTPAYLLIFRAIRTLATGED